MGDLFWNKIFAAVIATALVVFGIRELSHTLIHAEVPKTPGYAVEVPDIATAGPVEEVVVVSLAELLASASITSGERVAKKCGACHTFENGQANKIGPNLWNVIGQPAAGVAGFRFSSAMQGSGVTWDFETLDAFLLKPRDVVPGTAMSFAGIRKPKDRANLMAWMRAHSDAPVALPEFVAPIVEDVAEAAEAAPEAASDEAN